MNEEQIDSNNFYVEFMSATGKKWKIKTTLDEKLSELIKKFINIAEIDEEKLKDLVFLHNAKILDPYSYLTITQVGIKPDPK